MIKVVGISHLVEVGVAADDGVVLGEGALEEFGHARVVRKHHPRHFVLRVHVRRLARQRHLTDRTRWYSAQRIQRNGFNVTATEGLSIIALVNYLDAGGAPGDEVDEPPLADPLEGFVHLR